MQPVGLPQMSKLGVCGAPTARYSLMGASYHGCADLRAAYRGLICSRRDAATTANADDVIANYLSIFACLLNVDSMFVEQFELQL